MDPRTPACDHVWEFLTVSLLAETSRELSCLLDNDILSRGLFACFDHRFTESLLEYLTKNRDRLTPEEREIARNMRSLSCSRQQDFSPCVSGGWCELDARALEACFPSSLKETASSLIKRAVSVRTSRKSKHRVKKIVLRMAQASKVNVSLLESVLASRDLTKDEKDDVDNFVKSYFSSDLPQLLACFDDTRAASDGPLWNDGWWFLDGLSHGEDFIKQNRRGLLSLVSKHEGPIDPSMGGIGGQVLNLFLMVQFDFLLGGSVANVDAVFVERAMIAFDAMFSLTLGACDSILRREDRSFVLFWRNEDLELARWVAHLTDLLNKIRLNSKSDDLPDCDIDLLLQPELYSEPGAPVGDRLQCLISSVFSPGIGVFDFVDDDFAGSLHLVLQRLSPKQRHVLDLWFLIAALRTRPKNLSPAEIVQAARILDVVQNAFDTAELNTVPQRMRCVIENVVFDGADETDEMLVSMYLLVACQYLWFAHDTDKINSSNSTGFPKITVTALLATERRHPGFVRQLRSALQDSESLFAFLSLPPELKPLFRASDSRNWDDDYVHKPFPQDNEIWRRSKRQKKLCLGAVRYKNKPKEMAKYLTSEVSRIIMEVVLLKLQNVLSGTAPSVEELSEVALCGETVRNEVHSFLRKRRFSVLRDPNRLNSCMLDAHQRLIDMFARLLLRSGAGLSVINSKKYDSIKITSELLIKITSELLLAMTGLELRRKAILFKRMYEAIQLFDVQCSKLNRTPSRFSVQFSDSCAKLTELGRATSTILNEFPWLVVPQLRHQARGILQRHIRTDVVSDLRRQSLVAFLHQVDAQLLTSGLLGNVALSNLPFLRCEQKLNRHANSALRIIKLSCSLDDRYTQCVAAFGEAFVLCRIANDDVFKRQVRRCAERVRVSRKSCGRLFAPAHAKLDISDVNEVLSRCVTLFDASSSQATLSLVADALSLVITCGAVVHMQIVDQLKKQRTSAKALWERCCAQVPRIKQLSPLSVPFSLDSQLRRILSLSEDVAWSESMLLRVRQQVDVPDEMHQSWSDLFASVNRLVDLVREECDRYGIDLRDFGLFLRRILSACIVCFSSFSRVESGQ
ncbi:MAG: hypothetical protein MHM6MM_000079 [Cercozoa sp. M6MM]